MLRLFEGMDFQVEKRLKGCAYEITMGFYKREE